MGVTDEVTLGDSIVCGGRGLVVTSLLRAAHNAGRPERSACDSGEAVEFMNGTGAAGVCSHGGVGRS